MPDGVPVFGICGYSEAGKTTLIESLIPELVAEGLRIAVVKHDCHGLSVDTEGKDSDRFYKAGADVVAHGGDQAFFRAHGTIADLDSLLRLLVPHYDAVIVEGHKESPLTRKVWLLSEGENQPPAVAGPVDLVLDRHINRPVAVLAWIRGHLTRCWLTQPIYAGILIGGQASRMGGSKHLIKQGDETWVEHIVRTVEPYVQRTVLLGEAAVPESLEVLTRLPDSPGMVGPRAGMLAAMRWAPGVSWLFLACDMPLLSAEAVQWLLGSRRPGVWVILPRLAPGEGVEPLFALYDSRARAMVEACRRPSDLAGCPRVFMPVVPAVVAKAWRNVNTPQELRDFTREIIVDDEGVI